MTLPATTFLVVVVVVQQSDAEMRMLRPQVVVVAQDAVRLDGRALAAQVVEPQDKPLK